MSASIAEYRATMTRIHKLATKLRGYASARCWTVGGLTSGAMDDALALERRVRDALGYIGRDEYESSSNKGADDNGK